MKTPTSLFDRPGRAAAVVGAVVAVSATAAVALVSGTAAADEPGRCTNNVNVRSEPDVTSRIVALCQAGTEVKVGEARDGFVQLTDLGGWAAQEFVSINGRAPAPAEPESSSDADDSSDSSGQDSDAGDDTADAGSTDTSDSGDGGDGDDSGGDTGEEGGDDSGDEGGDDSGDGQRHRGGVGGLIG
jgi:hypothetical protein